MQKIVFKYIYIIIYQYIYIYICIYICIYIYVYISLTVDHHWAANFGMGAMAPWHYSSESGSSSGPPLPSSMERSAWHGQMGDLPSAFFCGSKVGGCEVWKWENLQEKPWNVGPVEKGEFLRQGHVLHTFGKQKSSQNLDVFGWNRTKGHRADTAQDIDASMEGTSAFSCPGDGAWKIWMSLEIIPVIWSTNTSKQQPDESCVLPHYINLVGGW
jgi:hypothetical protein